MRRRLEHKRQRRWVDAIGFAAALSLAGPAVDRHEADARLAETASEQKLVAEAAAVLVLRRLLFLRDVKGFACSAENQVKGRARRGFQGSQQNGVHVAQDVLGVIQVLLLTGEAVLLGGDVGRAPELGNCAAACRVIAGALK